MRLSELKPGQSGVIVKTLGHGAFHKRMMEMGFVRGHRVEVMMSAPMRDPVKYKILDYEVSLRRSEAELVEVIPDNITGEHNAGTSRANANRDELVGSSSPKTRTNFTEQSHTINVALIGNPNCGKTSLFNIASGAREHVGNYSGVTVDAKTGSFQYGGYTFNIVDLPGTYSLASYSPEELYVRRYLAENTPDVIINVVVASNLERNLYLTTELIDMNRSMVIALNMYDELEASGDKLDYGLLGEMIGVPIIPTVSRSGRGVNKLFDTVIDVYECKNEAVRHVHVNLGHDIEKALDKLREAIRANKFIKPKFAGRYLAIKLLEGDREVEAMFDDNPEREKIFAVRDAALKSIEAVRNEDISSAIADEKYGFIAGALAETLTRGEGDERDSTYFIDKIVTNRVLGFPIFLTVMLLTFWLTFYIGSFPMDWIESGVSWLSELCEKSMPEGPVKDLVADGILGGVGGVIVFLPNILILYFCISFMEDSGYMARAAFIMDKMMHKIGLHGKSFIPLVMGFGCNVPAVMASRAIESNSSRIITILINPFMSCSARLPVYVLLIGTFFSAHAALVFCCLYLCGVLVAVMTARLLRRFWFGKDETPFVMELPPYRVPTMKASLRHMWGKGEQYLKKMGGIILVASIIVWALNYFPLHEQDSTAINPDGTLVETPSDDSAIDHTRDSYLEMIGKAVNPVMQPIGFHWRATVAAIAGIPAKEIVVSTLGVLYTGDEEASDNTLGTRLTAPSPSTGQPDFTPASALSFLVFILLYCPCMATLVSIVRETGSWRYGVFSALYNTAVAWLVAFATYRIALLF